MIQRLFTPRPDRRGRDPEPHPLAGVSGNAHRLITGDEEGDAWTEEQAAAVRRAKNSSLPLDWENLAEEIESLGKSQRTELKSQIRRIRMASRTRLGEKVDIRCLVLLATMGSVSGGALAAKASAKLASWASRRGLCRYGTARPHHS